MFSPGLLMVHDTSGSGKHDITELTRGQQLDNPFLEVCELHVVTGANDTSLVDAARKVRNLI
jgi:hypothetical protein